MTSASQKVLDEALRLADDERAELAERLLESLDPSKDAEVDEAWAAEIERRCSDRDAGRTQPGDWEDLRRRIESEIFGR